MIDDLMQLLVPMRNFVDTLPLMTFLVGLIMMNLYIFTLMIVVTFRPKGGNDVIFFLEESIELDNHINNFYKNLFNS